LREALRERGVQPHQRIFWADEMRVGLHGRVARVWAPRGVKVRQRVQIEYKWKYLALAVDVRSGEIYFLWIDSLKGADVAKAVRFWKSLGVEVIVWDRARSHRSLEVKELGLELIEQPPYSPELNPSERIFEEIRRRVEGRVYRDLDKKCEAVEEVLEELASQPQKVKRLVGWRWIQQAIEDLYQYMAAS